jgi:hypothetical protein
MIYGENCFSTYEIIAEFLKRKIFIYLLVASLHVLYIFANNGQIVFGGFLDQVVFSSGSDIKKRTLWQ